MAGWKINKIFLALLCVFILSGIGCTKGCKAALQDLLAKKQASVSPKDLQEISPSPPAKKPETEERTEKEAKIKDLDIEFLEDEEDSRKISSEKEGEEISPQASETHQPEDLNIYSGIPQRMKTGLPGDEDQTPRGWMPDEKSEIYPPPSGKEEDGDDSQDDTDIPDSGDGTENDSEPPTEVGPVDTYPFAQVRVGSPPTSVEIGSTFTVPIEVWVDPRHCNDKGEARGLGGYNLYLSYDPSVISYLSAVGGDVPEFQGLTANLPIPGGNSSTRRLFAINKSSNLTSPLGEIIVARISFKAENSGISPLNISIEELFDTDGEPFSIDLLESGSVTVK